MHIEEYLVVHEQLGNFWCYFYLVQVGVRVLVVQEQRKDHLLENQKRKKSKRKDLMNSLLDQILPNYFLVLRHLWIQIEVVDFLE